MVNYQEYSLYSTLSSQKQFYLLHQQKKTSIAIESSDSLYNSFAVVSVYE